MICPLLLGQETDTVLTLFSLVNQTGTLVKIRALADGQELFTREVPAQAPPSPRLEAPPSPPSPTIELKVPLKQRTQQLEVQELLPAGMRKTFTIAGFSRVPAGFRITLQSDAIFLTQDYYPAR
ncbi:MAG TPA: hypothetical protein VGX03_11295 [Candidatus Binatia bacterium]|nr:hypothetical protein [Candidatus Binatia bacterium]